MFFRRDNSAKVLSFSVLVLLVVVALSGMFVFMPVEVVSASTFPIGAGTVGDPWHIEHWHHLDLVRNYLSNHFVLANDLDSSTAGYTELASSTADGGAGWLPIGTNTAGNYFTGSFNGSGYKISNLFISRSGINHIGLFGYVEGGNISNIGLINVNITDVTDG
jgi:hypothetical protein